MNSITILFFFVPVLVVILLMTNVLLAAHRPDTEKVTAYECGFSPIYGQTRAPFSIQYYLVGILFLIFDLEILLLYPVAVTLYNVSVYGFWIAIIFFTVLTLGFVYEIGSGVLYFTDQRSAISRPTVNSSNVLYRSMFFIHSPAEQADYQKGVLYYFICIILIFLPCLLIYVGVFYIRSPDTVKEWFADFKHGFNGAGKPQWWVSFSNTYFAMLVRIVGSISLTINQVVMPYSASVAREINSNPYLLGFLVITCMCFYFYLIRLSLRSLWSSFKYFQTGRFIKYKSPIKSGPHGPTSRR